MINDEIPCFVSKMEIAKLQMERAIVLFLDDKNHVSAITLAGASEEIFGAMLVKQGKIPFLKSHIDLCKFIGGYEIDDRAAEKAFAQFANYFRNGFNHHNEGENICFSQTNVVEILERAIYNFLALGQQPTLNINRFYTAANTY